MTDKEVVIDEDAMTEEYDLENMPFFIASQLRPGHVLTENDVKAVQAVIKEMDDRENAAVDEFYNGRMDAYRHIGGEDLVTAVKMENEEFIARISRNAMDKLFPKRPKVMQ